MTSGTVVLRIYVAAACVITLWLGLSTLPRLLRARLNAQDAENAQQATYEEVQRTQAVLKQAEKQAGQVIIEGAVAEAPLQAANAWMKSIDHAQKTQSEYTVQRNYFIAIASVFAAHVLFIAGYELIRGKHTRRRATAPQEPA